MKYACLCYEVERALKLLSESQWNAIGKEVCAYNEELVKKGRLIGAQALQSVESAVTVRVRNGAISATDGPFAETKEQLGGFFLIEAKDRDEAIQLASRLMGARLGCIEVRPIRELELNESLRRRASTARPVDRALAEPDCASSALEQRCEHQHVGDSAACARGADRL